MPSHSQSFTAGPPDAPCRVLIFHGYTGSPDEFRHLADELVRRLDAYVCAPLLPGHGTRVEDLENYSLEDLLGACKKHVEDTAASGKPFAIIGHSLGAQFALLASKDKNPSALVLTVASFSLRYPFSIPGLSAISRMRRFWNKKLSPQEIQDRGFGFYYTKMPGIALSFVVRANRMVRRMLPQVHCPMLTINNREDPLCHPEGGAAMLSLSGANPLNKAVILENRKHGLFYGPGKEEAVEEIVSFLEKVFKR